MNRDTYAYDMFLEELIKEKVTDMRTFLLEGTNKQRIEEFSSFDISPNINEVTTRKDNSNGRFS